jgi:hypothetical protein
MDKRLTLGFVAVGALALAGAGAVLLIGRGSRPASSRRATVSRSGSQGGSATAYDDLTTQARDLIQSRQYPQATLLLNRAIQLDPAKPEARDLLGQTELYVFGQLPASIQNYKSVVAHGGTATFHVRHDHGNGHFDDACHGLLKISPEGISYQAEDSDHSFSITRAQMKELDKNHFLLSEGGPAVDPHSFHLNLVDGKTYCFGPMSRFTEAERDLILSLGKTS